MAFNGKNRGTMLCGIATCGRKAEHILKNKAHNVKTIKYMCVACHRSYNLGKTHQRQRSKYYTVVK